MRFHGPYLAFLLVSTVVGGMMLSQTTKPKTGTSQKFDDASRFTGYPFIPNVALEKSSFEYGETVCLPGDGLIAKRSLVFYRKDEAPITTRERIVAEQVFNKMKPELHVVVSTGSPLAPAEEAGKEMLGKFNDGVKAKLGYFIEGYNFTWSDIGPIERRYCKTFSRTDVTLANSL